MIHTSLLEPRSDFTIHQQIKENGSGLIDEDEEQDSQGERYAS